jgi:hypothetical protein
MRGMGEGKGEKGSEEERDTSIEFFLLSPSLFPFMFGGRKWRE